MQRCKVQLVQFQEISIKNEDRRPYRQKVGKEHFLGKKLYTDSGFSTVAFERGHIYFDWQHN